MASWQRTHTCGELTAQHEGQTVVLNGWIDNHRHHGGILFVDLRDRYGVTQVTVDSTRPGTEAGLFERVSRLGLEDVISVRGVVSRRVGDQINRQRATGEIEVMAQTATALNEAEPTPFAIVDAAEASEETRMQYRYLDLRRRPMQHALVRRAAFVQAVREYLAGKGFVDTETPILTKSTPEGARDYLVPSRVHPGEFYALPQSPQLFKQLMMVAGMDRYYQIARCFRDEDLRADRQPEFTQIDLEMSFVEEQDVMDMVEGMLVHAFREGFGIRVQTPFPRLDHAEAIARYGSDKPDLRFAMELQDLTELARRSAFQVFQRAVTEGGMVKGLVVGGAAERFSRKDIDELTAFVGGYGAKGLAWAKVGADGLTGSIARFYEGAAGKELIAALAAKPGDLLLFVADKPAVVHKALGELRLKVGGILGLRTPGEFRLAWVTQFPLFEWNEARRRWDSAHHPFTAPVDWDITEFGVNTGQIRARAYDVVMNGWELGSGSIRIHRADVQQRVFEFLGIAPEAQRQKFGFLLDAFRFGAPPHGGIALGVDRLVALCLGLDSIRDAIAFPKTASATCLMTGAPSPVAADQLAELRIAALPRETKA
ncbi:MAG: aspartate--tRNA ligase [Planctomycetes bacterium]|nr:aspartate--tRNA ligase [Planctomycetota bacterium]